MWLLPVAGGAIVLYWVIRLAVGHAMQDVERRRLRDRRRVQERRHSQDEP
jgi:hypothetical protein